MPRAKTRDKPKSYSIRIPLELAERLMKRSQRLGATLTDSWAERFKLMLMALERPGE